MRDNELILYRHFKHGDILTDVSYVVSCLEGQLGKMIMKANMRGGTDNITVACIKFGGE